MLNLNVNCLEETLKKTLKIIIKINTELTNEFFVEKYFRNCTDLLENFVYFK